LERRGTGEEAAREVFKGKRTPGYGAGEEGLEGVCKDEMREHRKRSES